MKLKKVTFLCAISLLIAVTGSATPAAPVGFDQYPSPVFRGKVVKPDFKGAQKKFASLRTNLAAGFRGPAEFAGSLRVIEIGCGTGCVSIYFGDLGTGQVYETALGGEDHSQLSLQKRADSRLLIATWADDFEATSCTAEAFVWEGRRLRSISSHRVKCPN